MGLLLLIVFYISTLSASLGVFPPGAGRTPGSSAQTNGATVFPVLTSTSTPTSSAPVGPTAIPTPSPAPSFPMLRFSVIPSRFVDHCGTHKATLPPKTLLLDNSGSTVPVTWKVQITTTDQTGHLWATATPASGSISAGQHATLLLLPTSKLCQHTKGTVTYQALLTYQGGGLADTIRIADLVTNPWSKVSQTAEQDAAQRALLIWAAMLGAVEASLWSLWLGIAPSEDCSRLLFQASPATSATRKKAIASAIFLERWVWLPASKGAIATAGAASLTAAKAVCSILVLAASNEVHHFQNTARYGAFGRYFLGPHKIATVALHLV